MSHLTALVPGQGSQFVGMGRFLVDEFPIAKPVFEEASDAIRIDMKKLCFDGPESDLALTHNTQPAILTVSRAVWKVLQSESQFQVRFTAGHSVGEYGALVMSEVIDFATAIKAVRLRGELMQSAVPVGVGGMAAVMGMTDPQVIELCQICLQKIKEVSGQSASLSPANFNSPGQVVISGHLSAIEFLRTNIKSEIFPESLRKAKLIPLNVSAPFHCDLMKPAEEKMGAHLKTINFKNTDHGVLQNFTARLETDGSLIRESLIRQISGPVKWTESVQELKRLGSTKMIECGAGKVLTGLIKKIDPEIEVLSTGTVEDLKQTLQRIQAGLA